MKKGQVYSALADIKAIGMVILKAAGSGGFYCIIPKGTKVVIENNPVLFSKGVGAIPINYTGLEEILVPIEERKSPVYNMFTLVITYKDLKQYFVKENMAEIKFDDERAQKYWENISKRK